MSRINRSFEELGSAVLLVVRSCSHIGTLPRQFPRFIEQCYLIGYTTLPIVAILSFFIGSVLALQTGYAMRDFAATQFIGSIVGLSMARELGPVMVAILLAGRVGSAITAELASMKVYQEIDALVTMNIPPERMLVLPRLAAVLFMMPVLTIIANMIGWFGGAVVSRYVSFIDLDMEAYYLALTRFVRFEDVFDGIAKAEIFGFLVIVICCNVGLRTRGGPREIGFSVTRSVVLSLIAILVTDYFVTRALL